VTKRAGKSVFLEPTEEQKLRLQLAHAAVEVNFERRERLDMELRFYEAQMNLCQLALYVAETTKTQREEERGSHQVCAQAKGQIEGTWNKL
jgi:hypothetical protein